MNNWRQGSISIREARPRDLDAIGRLENESFESDRVSRRSLREFLRAPHRPVTVATIDDELAGYVLVSLRKGARALRIYSLAVGARFARRGVGRALLQRVGDRALRELRLPPVRRAHALLCGRGDRVTLRKTSAAQSSARNREQFPA
jgi:ribosomal protein S18 acetylase RimI-like enzyme